MNTILIHETPKDINFNVLVHLGKIIRFMQAQQESREEKLYANI